MKHLLVVTWVDTLSVVKEVFLEKNAGDLGNLWLIAAHVGDEELQEGSWIGGSLVVELGFGSLSVSVVGTKNILEEVL